MNPTVKKILNITSYVLVGLVFVFSLFMVIMSFSKSKDQGDNFDGAPSLFGKYLLSVQSGSMVGDNPDSFNEGDLVIGKKLKSDTVLETGMIVTFRMWSQAHGAEILNTHRIVDYVKNDAGEVIGYVTKGDANKDKDPGSLARKDIIAVYKKHISGMGAKLDWLQGRWGFFTVVLIPLFLFFAYRLVKLILLINNIQREKKGAPAAEANDALLREIEELRKKVALQEGGGGDTKPPQTE